MKAILVIGCGLLLAGCANGGGLRSISGGECKIVHTPPYAIAGKTQYDQNWADDTTEALVRGCGQPRPHARPASLRGAPKVIKTPEKKKHFWQKPAKQAVPLPTPAPTHAPVTKNEPPPPQQKPEPSPQPKAKAPWYRLLMWPFNP